MTLSIFDRFSRQLARTGFYPGSVSGVKIAVGQIDLAVAYLAYPLVVSLLSVG